MRIIAIIFSVLLVPLAAAGETADGTMLAQSCTSCHGLNGQGGSAIPALAGQDAATLLATMQALKAAGVGAPVPIMSRLLRDYDDDELQALADWFAGVEQ